MSESYVRKTFADADANHVKAEKARKKRIRKMRSVARFTPVPANKRRSTRGLRGATWLTKAWTPARRRDRNEYMGASA